MSWGLPTPGLTAALVAALLTVAVLVWPAGGRARSVRALFSAGEVPARSRAPRRSGLRVRLRRVLSRFRRRAAPLQGPELLAIVDALAPALEAGLGSARAWGLAVGSLPGGGDETAGTRRDTRLLGATSAGVPSPAARELCRAVADAAAAGDPMGPVLRDAARRHRSRPLALLGIAWALSEQTGAPLAPVTRTVGTMIRADVAAERRLESVATQSRITARILTALPVAGPLLAVAVGVDLARLATSGPWVWISVGVGMLLAGVGRVWLGRLAERVTRGPTVS